MNDFLKCFDEEFSLSSYKCVAQAVAEMESSFCYRDFRRSAGFCLAELRRAGAVDAQLLPFKADGKTVYGDFIMPRAWDVDEARLEITSPLNGSQRVLADLRESRFCVANRCGPTPTEGIETEVVHVANAGVLSDLAGKMAFVDDIPPSAVRDSVVSGGGAGIISAFAPAGAPSDGIYWINGWASGPGWYQTRDDAPLPCFSISPARGAFLLRLLRKNGKVKVRARVVSRLYDGKINCVTGRIPGRRSGEIVFIAHIYEPMLTDNAAGAAALIEICRVFNKLYSSGRINAPELGIRFLFTMERYATAAYFSKPRPEIVAAVNVDSIAPDPCRTGCMALRLKLSPFSVPFAGDYLFERIIEKCLPKNRPVRSERPDFSDDTIVSGPGLKIPSVYLSSAPGRLHHNSLDRRMMNWDVARDITRVMAVYAHLLTRRGAAAETAGLAAVRIFPEAARMAGTLKEYIKFENPGLTTAERDEAGRFIFDWAESKIRSLRRLGPGRFPERSVVMDAVRREVASFKKMCSSHSEAPDDDADIRAENIVIGPAETYPFCLSRVPRARRMRLPVDYDAMLNWADGKRDLSGILARINIERVLSGQNKLSIDEKWGLTRLAALLAKHGYIDLRYKRIVRKKDIAGALRGVGVRRGDRIVVHSSLSSIGHVEGGAQTVCEALMETVGEKGVVIMPSFNHGVPFRPGGDGFFSPVSTPTVNGAVAECFRRMPGVFRSFDPTHAFCAWGRNAESFVSRHHLVTTMGRGSPLDMLEGMDGKILLIGAAHANTFHHVVEMTNHAPCLGKRTEEYPVKLPSGEMVKCRTWGWRKGRCPVTDSGVYWDMIRKKRLARSGMIGRANILCLEMSDCRRVIEQYLKGRMKGYAGCRGCGIRPDQTPFTLDRHTPL